MYSALHAGGPAPPRAGAGRDRGRAGAPPGPRPRLRAARVRRSPPPAASAWRAGRARTSAAWPPTSARRSGAAGHVEALVRTRVGPAPLEDAVPWAAIQEGDAAVLAAGVLPADRAVGHLPAVRLSPEAGRRLGHGQRVPRPSSSPPTLPARPGPCRLYAGATLRRDRRAVGRAGSGRCASSMRIVRGLDQYPPDAPPSVVAQGTFDGIHLGHQAVIRTAVERARALGVRPVAVTFDPNPLAVLRPAEAPPELLPLDERLERIAELGPGGLPRHPVHGRVRAGRGRGLRAGRPPRAAPGAGDRRRLQPRVRARGARDSRAPPARWPSRPESLVHVVAPLRVDGVAVSSTSIREALRDGRRAARGEPARAAPTRFAGVVTRGAGPRARRSGSRRPTWPAAPGLLLADGVYAARAAWDGESAPAVVNVGRAADRSTARRASWRRTCSTWRRISTAGA